MIVSDGFDLSYCPATYFSSEPSQVRTVQQEYLRTRILAMLEDGDVHGLTNLEDESMDLLLDLVRTERLSKRSRDTAGKIHPALSIFHRYVMMRWRLHKLH